MRARNEMIVRDERAMALQYAAQQSMPVPAVPQMPPEVPEPSLLRAVWRHFWLVIVFAVFGAGGAWFYLKHTTPMYTSTSKIYIEPTGPRVLTETLGSAQRSNYLYTQAELIK